MNLDHLRKQAKNLRRVLPDIVEQHGSTLTLAQAQNAIARVHGYPDWKAALVKTKPQEQSAEPIASVLRAHLRFVCDPEVELATHFSSKTGDATRHALGVEAILRPLSAADDERLRAVDDDLDRLFIDEFGGLGGFDAIPAPELERALAVTVAGLKRCPYCVEAINRQAGVLFTLERYDEAMAVAEPAATALLDMIPTDHALVQVPYGMLVNRPFYRLVYCYLLLLKKCKRGREAKALAKRMVQYCPMDNMGFRFG